MVRAPRAVPTDPSVPRQREENKQTSASSCRTYRNPQGRIAGADSPLPNPSSGSGGAFGLFKRPPERGYSLARPPSPALCPLRASCSAAAGPRCRSCRKTLDLTRLAASGMRPWRGDESRPGGPDSGRPQYPGPWKSGILVLEDPGFLVCGIQGFCPPRGQQGQSRGRSWQQGWTLSPHLSHRHPAGAPCHPSGCGAPLSPPAWSGVGWGWPVTGATQPPAEVSPL